MSTVKFYPPSEIKIADFFYFRWILVKVRYLWIYFAKKTSKAISISVILISDRWVFKFRQNFDKLIKSLSFKKFFSAYPKAIKAYY